MHPIIKRKQSFYKFLNEQSRDGTISRKACLLTVCLATISTFMIVFGIVMDFSYYDPLKGVVFWVLATLTGLPGFYVLYLLR